MQFFLQKNASECVEKKCVLKNARLPAINFALLQFVEDGISNQKEDIVMWRDTLKVTIF